MARRKALGWSAERLAEVAKISYPALRDIEAGINKGREETKSALARALGCSLSDLYADAAEKASSAKPSPADLKLLIESEAETLPLRLLEPLLAAFLGSDPPGRATALAALLDDKTIAEPYLKRPSASVKAAKVR
ncbi:MAG: helix-turn-helix domain-containing protein [Bdellovibrionales bacterium]